MSRREMAVVAGYIESVDSRFDKLIEWLLVGLLAFMPLAFGAVDAWSEEVVIALAAAISICFLLKLVLERNANVVWSWAYVPVAAFVLIVVLQMIQLPTGFVAAISPGTASLKKELLGDLPNSGETLKSMTLSFYPHATKHDLRLVLAIASVFIVVVNTYRQPEKIQRLLIAIAVIGGSVALLALVQGLFGNGKIYWLVPIGGSDVWSGTFVNHSHYGQFINLSIGAALGLIMVKLHEAFTGKNVTPLLVFEYLSSPPAKIIWILVGIIVLGAASIFVSLTRGGMISMLIAGAFTVLVIASRRSMRGRGWIMALMTLGAFICVLYIGFDAVYDRLATLRKLHEYEGRWQIVKDIAVAWTRFPVLGTGLGTHEVVYPMFDRSTTPALASHAENEYAQAAEETGLIGLVLLVAVAVAVWWSYVRNVASAYTPIRSVAYGLGFGLFAIMVHSFSDFGQHLPANAFLSAISCALLLALASLGQKDNRQNARLGKVSAGRLGLRLAVLACTAGVWVWALIGANNARVAESYWSKALAIEQTLSEKGWLGDNDEYAELIRNASAAAYYQSENVQYRHWLNVYRWHSISRITDPNTGGVLVLPETLGFAKRIVDELHRARALCPTFGATYCVLGQLEMSVLGDPNGAERIRNGFRLAPCDPTSCFVAGVLDAEEGLADAAFAKLGRAVELNGVLFTEAANVFINHLDRPDLAVKLAGDNTGWLSQVANLLSQTGGQQLLAEQARSRVVELLKSKCQQPDAPAWAFASLAGICARENDNIAAIENYRRALVLDYGQVQWRFSLALLLSKTDRIPEAIHEARICLRLRPEFTVAKKFIADLSVHPAALGKEGQADVSGEQEDVSSSKK